MNQSSFPVSGYSGHSPSPSVSNLARNFSETSLKSDESLFAEQGPTKNPKVFKRPPLLVSNQAYDTVVQPTASETPKPGPPARPLKPSELRGAKAGPSDNWNTVNSPSDGIKRSQTAGNFWKQKDADASSPSGSAAVPAPVIPQKPIVPGRPAGTMPVTRSSTNPSIQSRPSNESFRPESTMSVLNDGTPFRPSNPKTLDPSLLSSDLIKRYKALFAESDLDRDGLLNGEQVRAVWQRSGLDNRSLGLIWTLSDLNDDGLLDSREFCIGRFATNAYRKYHS
jgi:hypothetical protein